MIQPNNTTASSNATTKNMIKIISKQRRGLNICHINAQSLTNKMDEFRYLFEDSGTDIVCISETWFSPDISDKVISPIGFNLFRNDRSSHGGGVAIYARKNISCKLLSKSNKDEKVEYIFIEVTLNTRKLLIGSVYRPNRTVPYEMFKELVQNLSVEYDDVIIAGDLNSNILKESHLVESFTSIGLYNVNSVNPTHFTSSSNTLLDIFLVANISKVLLYEQLSAPCFSKHDLIMLSYDAKCHVETESRSFYDLRNIDMELLELEFSKIDWDVVFTMPNCDDQLAFLNANLQHLFNMSVPVRNSRTHPTGQTWFNSYIKHLIGKRDDTYARWKRFKLPSDHEEYRALRKYVNKAIRVAKARYYASRYRSAVNTKEKWKIIREIAIGKNESILYEADADKLNENFINVPKPSEILPETSSVIPTSIVDCTSGFESLASNVCYFGFHCINPSDVLTTCLSVRSNAVGFDGLCPRFIKILLPNLLHYITYVFNTILTTSLYPSSWKYAKVIPIPKSKSSHEYRPISILPYLSKVFEKLMHLQITDYLSKYNLLTDRQSGFRIKHSCITALTDVTNSIRDNMDNHQVTFLVLLDHSKAFDCVDHTILCSKLRNQFNFSTTAIKLLSTYLHHRTQSVVIGNNVSTPLEINSGVPQGSVLGPLLFSLYINDLPEQLLHCKIHMYADDVQLHLNSSHLFLSEGVSKLNCDLDRVTNWALANKLHLNPKKSKCIIISNKPKLIRIMSPVLIGKQQIELVSSAKNLGITLNDTLTWNNHVAAATGKIFGMIRTLYVSQYYTPKHIRLLLAKTYLIPSLLYGCELFASCDAKSLSRLNVAYNAILRYVFGLNRYESCAAFSKSLYGVSLENLLKIRTLTFLQNIIYSKEPPYLFSLLRFGRSNRGMLIIPIRHRRLISERHFIVNSTRLWNSLPFSIQTLGNAISFKRALFSHFNNC